MDEWMDGWMDAIGGEGWDGMGWDGTVNDLEKLNDTRTLSPSLYPLYLHNPFPLLLNLPQIIKTRVHVQFWRISGWPI